MIGAIIGDVVGSVYENAPIKTTNFNMLSTEAVFTDDTVLTIAVAEAILAKTKYETSLKKFARRYPNAGYGMSFYQWMMSDDITPYHSWGNGSAMRVSPVGFAFERERDVLAEAEKSASVTHNHPEGIKGAQATAMAIFWSMNGKSKTEIRDGLMSKFGYDLNRRLDDIRPGYRFDVSCQGSVPEAMIAFLEADDFEGAIRNAISLGGDSDTQACIAGGIAQAFYKKIPEDLVKDVFARLPDEFVDIIERFNEKYGIQF
jgi:ADP-ribosylglycohydrolase